MAALSDLTVKMDVDSAKFRAEISNAAKSVTDFGKTIESMKTALKGALALGGIYEAGKAIADLVGNASEAADKMNDFSLRTGIAVETLSRLSYAAKMSGSDTDELAVGLKKFAKYTTEAAAGSKAQAEVFRDMGIQAKGADGAIKPMEQLIGEVAEKFAGYRDGAEKTALAIALFGKAGDKLIPMLNEGKDGLEKLTREADKLGITLSTKTARAAADFEDNLDKLKMASKNLGRELFASLAPALQQITDDLVDAKEESAGDNSFAESLATGLKVVATVAAGVAFTIHWIVEESIRLGKVAVALATTNFDQSGVRMGKGSRGSKGKGYQDTSAFSEQLREINAEEDAALQKYGDFIEKLWNGKAAVSPYISEKAIVYGLQGRGLGDLKTAPKVKDPTQQTATGSDPIMALQKAVAAQEKALIEQALPALDKYEQEARSAFEAGGELAEAFDKATHGTQEQALAAYRLRDAMIAMGKGRDQMLDTVRKENAQRQESIVLLERLKEAEQEHKEQIAAAKQIMDAVATPTEKYIARMRELQKVYATGKLPLDQFNRATKQTAKEYKDATEEMSESTRAFAGAFESVLSEHLFDGFKKGMSGFFSDLVNGFKRVVAQMIAHMIAMKTAMWVTTGSPYGASLPVVAGGSGPPIPGFAPGLPSEITAPTPSASGGFVAPDRTAVARTASPTVVRHDHRFDDRMQRTTFEQALERHIANVRATR